MSSNNDTRMTMQELWRSTLGEPPMLEQFGVWAAMHTEDVVRLAILRTARKNISLNGTMSLEYKMRFASKVALVQSQRNAEHALNKARLQAEMSGVQQ
jgi:hypothetical protein